MDNLRKRDAAEVDYLLNVIETVVTERLARPGASWQVHLAGWLDSFRALRECGRRDRRYGGTWP